MFSSHSLTNCDQETITAEKVIEGKVVALLFSAKWSPPCHDFVPKLAEMFKELHHTRHLPFEVIFVSMDKSEDDMLQFMSQCHGDWWATEFDSSLTKSVKSNKPKSYRTLGYVRLVTVF